MKFYTNISCIGNTILYRGYENGERISERVNFKPTLFLPVNKPSAYKTLEGQNCEKIEFPSIAEARDFVKQYSGVDGFRFFGNTRYVYVYIADRFPGVIEYDPSQIVTANLDIEVAKETAYASVEDPFEEVIAITVKAHGRFYVFGCKDFTTSDPTIKYIKSRNEPELLRKFLEFWQSLAPDVVTGWNVQFYDIPYLVNRIARVLGEKETKKLSPWGYLSTRQTNYKGRNQQVVELVGISTLDYIELYRKFQVKQESEKLNYIAYVELGEKKVDYSEYDSLHDLYKKNYQKFIEYNIKDVELVDKLEQKLQLINMAYALAFDAKVNFPDVFMQVRMCDSIIFSYLKQKKVVLPQVGDKYKDEQYLGGYVKEVKAGLYEWVLSLDLNSLYPMLIAQFNISPETLLAEKFLPVSIKQLLDRTVNLDDLKDEHRGLAANGHSFTNDKVGFFPDILMRMYEDRKTYKKKMLDAQKELELVKQEMTKRGI